MPYEHFFYLPFGEVAVHQHANNDGYSNPYQFSLSEFNDAIGLILMGARYYDPMLSLWMSADPMSSFRSWLTPYNYVANNPVMFVDPSGLLESSIKTGDKNPGDFPSCSAYGDPSKYIIQPGDTFWHLESRFGIPHGYLQKANPGLDPNNLSPGQEINIPQKTGGYWVFPDDSDLIENDEIFDNVNLTKQGREPEKTFSVNMIATISWVHDQNPEIAALEEILFECALEFFGQKLAFELLTYGYARSSRYASKADNVVTQSDEIIESSTDFDTHGSEYIDEGIQAFKAPEGGFNATSFADEIVALNKATDGGGNLLNGTPSSAINSAMYYETAAEQGAYI